MDPTEQQLLTGLVSADRAGDAAGAQHYADQLRALYSQPAMSDVTNTPLRGPQDATPTPIPQASAPQPSAASQEAPQQDYSGVRSTVNAFLQPFAGDTTFGVAPAAEAGLASVMYGVPYGTARGAVENQNEALAAQHPYANALGHLAGLYGGVKVLGGLLPEWLEPQAGQGLRNVAKAAGVGGALSGGEEAINGGSGRDIATAAGIGAVLGPVAGKVGETIGRAATGVTNKAWRYLAQKIGTSADDLDAWVQDFRAATGQNPSIQQIVKARAAGGIKDFASKNPATAQMLREAQETTAQEMPGNVVGAIEQNMSTTPRPEFINSVPAGRQSPQALLDARDSAMTAALDPIRETPVSLPQDLVEDPHFNDLLSGRNFRDVRMKLADGGAISIDDVDRIRRAANKLATAAPGSPFYDIGKEVTAEGASQVPEYRNVLDKYGAASRYIEGFSHSYGSGAPMETATDSGLRRSLASAEGQQGHANGVMAYYRNRAAQNADKAIGTARELSGHTATSAAVANAVPQPNADNLRGQAGAFSRAAQSAAESTPGTITPAAESDEAGRHLVVGAAEAAGGLHYTGAARVGRALATYFGSHTFPEDVQRQIAAGLTSTDPAVVRSTLTSLRQGETNAKSLKALANAISGMAGMKIGQFLSQPDPAY
ncbi:MAG TPA: hypothetical protein VHC00_00460 [Rhizobiaceae bacterium]|nr:hypothetical protein [Rhizobiaceae bacterium]